MATPIGAGNEDIGREGLDEVQDYFTIDKSDANLVKMINRKVQGAYPKYEELRKEGKINERYWAADQLKGITLYWHNSRIVQNRIYMSVETMVPIITSKPAEPIIGMGELDDEEEESEEERQFVREVTRLLQSKYHDVDHPQQEVFEMVARHWLLYKVGIPKIRWDKTIDDYIVEFVHPHKVIISPDGYYNEDVWTAEYLEWTLQELLDEFPEKENDIMANLFPGTTPSDEVKGTPIGFWEYWSEDGKFVVWKMQDVILQKKLNPYIKWKDLEEGETGNSSKEFDRDANHFDYPKKPLMFLNSQNLGRHIWDDTTPVSQGRSLQNGINLMQRIITDTSRDQGIIVGAQELIDRDELYKYTGAFNEKLSVKGADPTKAIYRVPPKQLQTFVQDNQTHLENSLDNIMGTHAISRGEKSKQPTLGQDVLSKEGDFGRIDAIVRGVERVANEIYNWELQMIAVKYEQKHYQKVLGDKRGKEVMKAVKEGIKKGINITVKPGSTLPTDKLSQRTETLELGKAGKISDIDFFERMDFPNPKEMAKRLFLQENAPQKLYPKLVKELEEDAKKKAKEQGRLREDGTIEPELSVAAGQVPPPGVPQVLQPAPGEPVPQIPIGQAPQAAPLPQASPEAVPGMAPQEPVPLPVTQPVGTEHTQALIQGQPIQPFQGVVPSPEHVSAELQFMGSDEFAQLPEPVQALYARHVLNERDLLGGQNAEEVGAVA